MRQEGSYIIIQIREVMLMRKKILPLIILLTIMLTGCSLFNKSSGKLISSGSMKITTRIPVELLPAQSRDVLSGITISTVEFIITNGEKTFSKSVDVMGDTIEVGFTNLQPGVWNVTVIAKETGKETLYDVFKGHSSGRVKTNEVTKMTVEMDLVPGSISLGVSIPEDFSELETVQVSISNLVSGENYIQTYTKAELEQPILLDSLTPTSWDVKIQALNSAGDLLAEGSKVFDVKPGRRISNVVSLNVGSLTIETIWNMPPSKPTNLSAEATSDQIKLSWDPIEGDIKGYAVARSDSPDGDWTLLTETLINETQFIDTSTWYLSKYYYSVAAYTNDALYSGWSEPIIVSKGKNLLNVTIVGKGTVLKTPDDNGSGYDYTAKVM